MASANGINQSEIICIIGPRLIGLLFNWALLGLLTAQVYFYHASFPRDRWCDRFIAYTLYVLEWAQTCSATHDAFQWFVYGWGSVPALLRLWTEWLNTTLLTSVIAAVIQLFYGWRILTLGDRNKVLPIVITVLSIMQLGGGLGATYFMFNHSSEILRTEGLIKTVAVRMGGSALADMVIACAMTFSLLGARKHAYADMDIVITRLVRLTVETGTLTAVVAIVDLIFFFTERNALHTVSALILGKLHTNALLVLYNNRAVSATPMPRSSEGSSVMFSTIEFGAVNTTVLERTFGARAGDEGTPKEHDVSRPDVLQPSL